MFLSIFWVHNSDVDPELCCSSFLVWWVLVLVCFPPVVKGPRGSTSPIRYKTTYICCRAALSLAFLTAGKKRISPSPHCSPPTSFSCRHPFLGHADACTIPRRQPRLPGFCKSCPQWLTTMQSPCHGLWWNNSRHQKDGQNKIKKRKMHHAATLPRLTTSKCRSLLCFAFVKPQHQS